MPRKNYVCTTALVTLGLSKSFVLCIFFNKVFLLLLHFGVFSWRFSLSHNMLSWSGNKCTFSILAVFCYVRFPLESLISFVQEMTENEDKIFCFWQITLSYYDICLNLFYFKFWRKEIKRRPSVFVWDLCKIWVWSGSHCINHTGIKLKILRSKVHYNYVVNETFKKV